MVSMMMWNLVVIAIKTRFWVLSSRTGFWLVWTILDLVATGIAAVAVFALRNFVAMVMLRTQAMLGVFSRINAVGTVA